MKQKLLILSRIFSTKKQIILACAAAIARVPQKRPIYAQFTIILSKLCTFGRYHEYNRRANNTRVRAKAGELRTFSTYKLVLTYRILT